MGAKQILPSSEKIWMMHILNMVKSLSVYPGSDAKQHDLKIVYTPIHGTGITLVPEVLKEFGFNNVTIVEEQQRPMEIFRQLYIRILKKAKP